MTAKMVSRTSEVFQDELSKQLAEMDRQRCSNEKSLIDLVSAEVALCAMLRKGV
jgi:hypothetical protein